MLPVLYQSTNECTKLKADKNTDPTVIFQRTWIVFLIAVLFDFQKVLVVNYLLEDMIAVHFSTPFAVPLENTAALLGQRATKKMDPAPREETRCWPLTQLLCVQKIPPCFPNKIGIKTNVLTRNKNVRTKKPAVNLNQEDLVVVPIQVRVPFCKIEFPSSNTES